jgi:hypothetical protein
MSWWVALLGAAVVWAWGRFLVGYPRPPSTVRILAPREYATIAAAASATFPRGGSVPPSGLDADVAGHVDRFVGAQVGRSRWLMRLLFILVEHGTLAFPPGGSGRRRRFSALTPPQQVAYLEGWRTSGLFFRRLVFTSLRAILTMGYLAHPTVLRELGLSPRAIESPPCAADGLWPPISAAPRGHGRS